MGRSKAESGDLGQAATPPAKPSEPISVARPSGRRHNYLTSGNHLLSFEVTSSPGSGFGASGSFGGSVPRRPQRPRPGLHFTKERFIHANFRFVALQEAARASASIFETDPDVPLEWGDIELVLVPAQQDTSCPICLDTPLAPRLTRCGHYFCWPCILQYAATTSSAGSGNWRSCPICFESINTHQLKSVRFQHVDDYAGMGPEVRQIGIPMILLRRHPARIRLQPVGSGLTPGQQQQQPPQSLADLDPFDKISLVDRQFVLEHIVADEMGELQGRLDMLEGGDESRAYIELALTMVDDRKLAMMMSGAAGGASPPKSKGDRSHQQQPPALADGTLSDDEALVYFHQAADGQPFFLSPLSIKILRKQFGTYAQMPTFLCAPVLAIEMAVMTQETRRRHRYLHHLPIGCQFGLCEVDLAGVVSSAVLDEFSAEIETRHQSRQSKAVREAKRAAAALRREQQKLESSAFDMDFEPCRNQSPSIPGVATGILGGIASMADDYENFPLLLSSDADLAPPPPPTSSQPSTPPTGTAAAPPRRPSLPTAGSFASIAAAASPPHSDFGGGFVVLSHASSTSPSSGVAPMLGFASSDDLPLNKGNGSPVSGDGAGASGGRKGGGKRMILVSNALHRRAS